MFLQASLAAATAPEGSKAAARVGPGVTDMFGSSLVGAARTWAGGVWALWAGQGDVGDGAD